MTSTDTTSKSRTERIPGAWAGQGAVRQNGGSLPVYRCTTCKREVVWVKSSRTGRRYLVNVRSGYKAQRFYQGNDLHGDCAEHEAKKLDDEKRRARFSQALEGWTAELQRMKTAGATVDELREAVDQMGQELEELKP